LLLVLALGVIAGGFHFAGADLFLFIPQVLFGVGTGWLLAGWLLPQARRVTDQLSHRLEARLTRREGRFYHLTRR
jgi:hypothetical protein